MKLGVVSLVVVALSSIASLSNAEVIGPDSVMFEDGAVQTSLTGVAGDAAKGRAIFINRKQGNCLACHVNNEITEQSFHGEVGPPLDGVAGRWEEPELRAILVNSKTVLGDETIMPSFYRLKNGARTMEKFVGKTILSADQVEDVLAYLKTLKDE